LCDTWTHAALETTSRSATDHRAFSCQTTAAFWSLECRLVRCCNYDESLAALQLLLCPRLSWHHHGRNRIATKPLYQNFVWSYLHFALFGYDIGQGLAVGHLGFIPRIADRTARRRSTAAAFAPRQLLRSCEEEQCRKGYKGGEPSNCHNCALSFSDY
jgi:hypothetical protein